MRFYALLAVLVTAVSTVRAQYDPNFSHYWAMESSFNPAAAGKESKLNIVGAYSMALTGFENSPKTMYIGADMPVRFLNKFHGVGANITNDEIGLFSHKKFVLQYAFKTGLFGGTISTGLQLGFLSESFDGSKVDTDMPNDPAFPTSEATGSGFDMSAGLYYTHKMWYAGLSVLHFNAPVVKLGENQEFQIDPTYYLTGGCNIKLRNPFLSIHPTVFGRYDGTAYRVDLTTRMKYTHDGKMFYGGLGYSPTNSVTVMVGGNFHGICLGYSYEVYTSAISFGNGAHELFVGYQMDLDFQKKGRNKHKSVRLL